MLSQQQWEGNLCCFSMARGFTPYTLYLHCLPCLSLGSWPHDRCLPRRTSHRFITTGTYIQSVSNLGGSDMTIPPCRCKWSRLTAFEYNPIRLKQGRQCTCNVILRRVISTIGAVEKQQVLHIVSVCS